MRKGKYKGFCIAAFASMALLLSACGSSASDMTGSAKYAAESAMEAAGYGPYDNAAMTEEAAAMADERGTGSGDVIDTSTRKLITTMNLDCETWDLDETLSAVEKKVSDLGGYIESSNIYNGTYYYDDAVRTAGITARIPASKLDLFVEMVEGSTNITSKSVNVQDVTLSYVDIESRKKSLRTEEKRLLDIMNSAESIEDIIAIEDKLSDVRYQLESIESQLRSYDNQVDYSTVYLNIEEVVVYTPLDKESAFERMSRGFEESLVEVGDGLVDFVVYVVSHIPQIILFIIVVIIIAIIVKLISAGNKKKRLKKAAMMQVQYQNMNPGYQPQAPQPGAEKGNDGQQ